MTRDRDTDATGSIFPTAIPYYCVGAITLVSVYFPLQAKLGNPRPLSFFTILELVWPIGFGIAMLLFTRHLYTTYQTVTENDHFIVGWTIAGWVATFGLTTLLILHQQSMQVAIFRPGVVIVDMAIGGAGFGLIIGGFHVATLDRQERLRSFRQAVEEAGHCIYFTDPDGTIEYVNPEFEDRTGYSAEEAIGRDSNILNSGKHDAEYFEEMWETILAGEVWENEIINRRKSGELTYADQTIAPVFDEDGEEIERFVAINSDITDIKEYEQQLEQLNDQLTALNRVIRHDIRNDMTVIQGWIDLIQDQIEDEGANEALEKIARSAEHVIELTDVAKGYVESLEDVDCLETEPIPLRPTIRQVVDSRKQTFPNASIRIEGQIPAVSVEANEMLTSVIRNLVNNAVQHNDKDHPVVEIAADVAGDTVEIAVADNGPGIPDDQKAAIFGKGEKGLDSDGTGIGLYLVDKWVSNFGGEIRIEDRDSTGARFILELSKATGA